MTRDDQVTSTPTPFKEESGEPNTIQRNLGMDIVIISREDIVVTRQAGSIVTSTPY